MNILFLIGNGFDINLGLKTKYSDFYKYYQTTESINETIENLKKNISEKHENWSDLELAIGNYCKNLKDINDLDIVIEDLGEKLSIYLQQQETNFSFDKIDKDKLVRSLAFPEKSLLPVDRNEIFEFKNKWHTSPWNVNIISFNYTNSIEKILDENYENRQLGNHHGKAIDLKKVYHVHGLMENRMILGVNDTSQINNPSFHKDIDILETIIKPESNKAVKDNIDTLCKTEISKANLICIFGSSLGKTDNMWWELIANRLLTVNTKLLIFRRSSSKVSSRISQKNQRDVRKRLNEFLVNSNLSDENKELIKDNIIISIDSDIFDLK